MMPTGSPWVRISTWRRRSMFSKTGWPPGIGGGARAQPAGEPSAKFPYALGGAADGYAHVSARHEVTAGDQRHAGFEQLFGGQVRLRAVPAPEVQEEEGRAGRPCRSQRRRDPGHGDVSVAPIVLDTGVQPFLLSRDGLGRD